MPARRIGLLAAGVATALLTGPMALIAPAGLTQAGVAQARTAPDRPSATAQVNGLAIWKLQSRRTQLAVNVGFTHGSTFNNEPLRQWWNRSNDWNNQWLQKPWGGGIFSYRNRWSNQCMTAPGTLTDMVEQLPCAEDGPAFAWLKQRQQWTWKLFKAPNGGEYSRVISVAYKNAGQFKILAVREPDVPGSALELQDYKGWDNQEWRWVFIGNS